MGETIAYGNVVVRIEANADAVEETQRESEEKLNEVETQRQETEINVRKTLVRSSRIISGFLGISVSAFEILGGQLDPTGRAIIGCITSTVTALHAISAAMASNPITAAFAVTTAAASIILSVKTLWEVTHGIDASKDEMRKVNDALRLAHSSYILFKGAEW